MHLALGLLMLWLGLAIIRHSNRHNDKYRSDAPRVDAELEKKIAMLADTDRKLLRAIEQERKAAMAQVQALVIQLEAIRKEKAAKDSLSQQIALDAVAQLDRAKAFIKALMTKLNASEEDIQEALSIIDGDQKD